MKRAIWLVCLVRIASGVELLIKGLIRSFQIFRLGMLPNRLRLGSTSIPFSARDPKVIACVGRHNREDSVGVWQIRSF
jgi:hypothetical protein